MSISPKIKVLFIMPSLSAGGAERVMSFVSQNINKELFDPVLLIASSANGTAYDVSNVKTIYLGKSRILTAIPLFILKIAKFKPHIVVSSIAHVNTAMSMIAPFFKKTKFIGREATIISKRKNEKVLRKRSPAHWLPIGFKNLDALICQSQDMAEDMTINFNVPKEKIHIINNPISHLPLLKEKQTASKPKKFITVGRLTEVKGHLRLLEILSQLEYPFEYTIIGNGHLKDIIFEKAKALGIFDNIKHVPFTDKVNDYLAQNDLFLQGSFVEGFPNALLESCIVGTPVIAFKAPGGTKEIVENNVNGFLVENEEEFIEKLKSTKAWDPEKIRASVFAKFNKELIIQQYEALFLDMVSNKHA